MACVAVIPARRAERSIRATLESLRLGNRGFVERVVVVTSDGDPTADIVRRWSEHDPGVELVIGARPQTAGAARNLGRLVAGQLPAAAAPADEACELLLFIDADCRLELLGAQRLAAELQQRGLCAATARIVGSRGLVARVRHILEFKEAASVRPAPARWLPPSTVMLCRADAFDRSGGFVDLWPGEDLVFAQTLRDVGGRLRRSDEVVAVHQHPAGTFEMLRHQFRLGRSSAVARRLRSMPGSAWTRSPWLALLLLPGRALRIAIWQAGEGSAAMAWTLALSPLLIAGLAAWTAGFAAGCARPQDAPGALERRGAAAA